MADIVKNRYKFWIGLRLCDLEDHTLQLRFHEISVELIIFWLQYSASNFGNPPLWTSLWRFVNGSVACLNWPVLIKMKVLPLSRTLWKQKHAVWKKTLCHCFWEHYMNILVRIILCYLSFLSRGSTYSHLHAIPNIKVLCNLRCLKERLRLLCNKLSMVQRPEPRFKTA